MVEQENKEYEKEIRYEYKLDFGPGLQIQFPVKKVIAVHKGKFFIDLGSDFNFRWANIVSTHFSSKHTFSLYFADFTPFTTPTSSNSKKATFTVLSKVRVIVPINAVQDIMTALSKGAELLKQDKKDVKDVEPPKSILSIQHRAPSDVQTLYADSVYVATDEISNVVRLMFGELYEKEKIQISLPQFRASEDSEIPIADKFVRVKFGVIIPVGLYRSLIKLIEGGFKKYKESYPQNSEEKGG